MRITPLIPLSTFSLSQAGQVIVFGGTKDREAYNDLWSLDTNVRVLIVDLALFSFVDIIPFACRVGPGQRLITRETSLLLVGDTVQMLLANLLSFLEAKVSLHLFSLSSFSLLLLFSSPSLSSPSLFSYLSSLSSIFSLLSSFFSLLLSPLLFSLPLLLFLSSLPIFYLLTFLSYSISSVSRYLC